jgi:hypothetical protein
MTLQSNVAIYHRGKEHDSSKGSEISNLVERFSQRLGLLHDITTVFRDNQSTIHLTGTQMYHEDQNKPMALQ